MDTIGGGNVIENGKSIAIFGLKQPTHPRPAITRKFEQKLLFVTARCDVSNVPRKK
jgi:hypothetical protein